MYYFYYLVYSLGFLIMSLVFAMALKRTRDALFGDAFYMLVTFSFCKGAATLVEFNLNIIQSSELDRIARYSFGYHSAILMSIALFNLFYILIRKPIGLIVGGIGFIFYSIFEGFILDGTILGVDVRILKLSYIFLMLASSFSLRSLLAEKKVTVKVAYL